MRKRNWRQHNKSLVQRGSLTFLVDPKSLKTLAPKSKQSRGRPLEFSDQLIQVLLMIKIHYRMLEGFTRFFLEQMRQVAKVPTYSSTCKRAKKLALCLPKLSLRRPSTVIVDATGIKIQGEGEWKVKIHVAIDAKTQEIVGEILTDACVDDGRAFPAVIGQVSNGVQTVIGDGAYDDKEVRELIRKRGAKPLIPPPKNGVCHGTDPDRDDAILIIRGFGGDKMAKSIWGKLTGYSQRALVETTFSRYKKMFGDRFFSKTELSQPVENRLKCVILNKMMKAIS